MKKNVIILLLTALFAGFSVSAETGKQYPFMHGSYQQILQANTDRPFILVIWSIYCAPCIKELEMLKEIQQANPQLKMVMLSIDKFSERDEVNEFLANKGLSELESWVFAEANSQKLRYEIDPRWYGEMPRTYFYNSQHERQGVSGVLSRKEYDAVIAEISQ